MSCIYKKGINYIEKIVQYVLIYTCLLNKTIQLPFKYLQPVNGMTTEKCFQSYAGSLYRAEIPTSIQALPPAIFKLVQLEPNGTTSPPPPSRPGMFRLARTVGKQGVGIRLKCL